MSLVIVNDVACPYCGERPGRPCRVKRGKQPGYGRPLAYPHEQRRLAFRIAKAAEPVRPPA